MALVFVEDGAVGNESLSRWDLYGNSIAFAIRSRPGGRSYSNNFQSSNHLQ